MAPLIEIQDLSIRFGNGSQVALAVKGVSLTISPGETLGLVGESGSGKSLTARAILGLTPPSAVLAGGRILWHRDSKASVDIGRLPRNGREIRALRGNRIAMVFQEPMASLSPVHTIGAQVATTLNQHNDLRARDITARVEALFEDVGLPRPGEIGRAYPHELSGGMRQRVMIAMALSCTPDLLICDEPTTALDATTEARITALLRDLQARRGMAMLFISHNIALVSQMSDRLIVMKAGEVIEAGKTQDVLRQPKTDYTRTLLAAVPRFATARAPRFRGHERAPLVNMRGVEKSFTKRIGFGRRGPKVKALSDVTLDIRAGETLALVGESGSGKSTLARCLMAAHPVSAGEITMRDGDGTVDVTKLDRAARKSHWRRAQMVFQDPFTSLNPRMTVLQTLAEPLRNFGIATGQDALDRVAAMLRRVGLIPEMMHRHPHAFSGGQRQRICIARALISEPKLVVADEPVSALDVSIAAQIIELFDELKAEMNLTYLLITHDLALAQNAADRVAVLRQGELVEVGPVDRVLSSPQAAYTQELLKAVPRLPSHVA